MKVLFHPSTATIRINLLVFAVILLAAPRATAYAWEGLAGHEEYVYTIAFSRDGRLMATGSGDNTAIVWNVAKQKQAFVFPHETAVYAAAISPDGKFVATASGDGCVALWNALDGSKITQGQLHKDAVYSVAFSPDGKWLASASQDGSVRVWCLSTASVSRVLEGSRKTNPFYGVVYSADGGWLAAVNDDCKLRIWRTSNWELVLEQRLSRKALYAIAFSPDQEHVLVAGEDGKIYSSDVREIESRHNR